MMWKRKQGELLRPSAWTDADVERAREQCIRPDFDTLYQQDPSASRPITAECFPLITTLPPSTASVVISVDCAQTDSPRSSYNVAQVWCPQADYDVLLDVWRERCTYRVTRKALFKLMSKYQPSRVLIEKTGYGSVLLEDIGARFRGGELVAVPRPSRSKEARFAPYHKYILAQGIRLPARADFVPDFIEELVNFPDAENNDNVDTLTQFLDDRKTHPILKPSVPQRVLGVVASKSAALVTANFIPGTSVVPGLAVRTSRGSAGRMPNPSPWGMPTPIEPRDPNPVLVATAKGPRWKLPQ